jgi:hypothetical protein
VLVRGAVGGRGLRLVACGIGIELVLELEHMAEQVVPHGDLRQARRAGEEVAERDGVLLQVVDGRGLAIAFEIATEFASSALAAAGNDLGWWFYG